MKTIQIIFFLMTVFFAMKATAIIPIFVVETYNKTGTQIGTELGIAIKNQFPEIDKQYDSYLASFVDQETFDRWVQQRVNVLKMNIKPAYKDEIDAIASVWGLSLHDKLGDGFLSWNEYWLLQLIPDVGRQTNCSGFGVFNQASALDSPIVGRNMDWITTQAIRSIQAITVYQNNNNQVVNIGFAGYLGIISGFNHNGLFVAHLDSKLGGHYPDPPVGDHAIVFDLREVLEKYDRINYAARQLSKFQYGFSHNILMADQKNVQVLEQPQGQSAHLRTDTSQLKTEKSWDKHNQIAVVNCFVLKASPNNCMSSVDDLRWHRFKTLAQFNRDYPAYRKDVVQIMFDTANPQQEIFNEKTVQSMVFTPIDQRLYLYTTPVSGKQSPYPVMTEITPFLPQPPSSPLTKEIKAIVFILLLALAGIWMYTHLKSLEKK
jgi:hypothetical protein